MFLLRPDCDKKTVRAFQNLTIFVTPMKRVDFSEVTGVRALKRPAREPWN